AWFADHLFYAPGDDYQYRFADADQVAGVRLDNGRLQLERPHPLQGDETLILALSVRSHWLGRFFDPAVLLSGLGETDVQTFERGVNGVRYLNLTGLGHVLNEGALQLRGRFCRLEGTPQLWSLRAP
ncbi:hypothetical protein, partial [Pandoraea sputorum]|uniref:hypothetical protein n=1 Tax=Pandoraea sputorum TaxID=93222 RepID=UPI00355677F4